MTKQAANAVEAEPQQAELTASTQSVDQQVLACNGDPNAFAQLIAGLDGKQRDAALAAAHRAFGNAFVSQALQDDDTIKVETKETRTPTQRAADLLARLTAADAKIARSELAQGIKKFRPKLEAEFQQFCLAYGYDSASNSRALFVEYLESAGLGAKPKAVTADQQANGAMNVLFKEAKPGERLSPTTIGLREALDPRNELTDEQREKLKSIILDDGRNALTARLEAEQLWKEKKINVVVDANAAYASGNPHLAAFTSAARDAGYTQDEIEMVTKGASAAQLWRPETSDKAMPATLEEYRAKVNPAPQAQFMLDATRLEDARAAIAQGMTLEQLDAARKQQGYDPSFKSKMTNESVTTVVEAYVSKEMTPVIGPLLSRLCSSDQAQRNAAASELQALISDTKRFGPANAKALRQAIDALQAQFGMQSDPMLKLLRVQLDMEAKPPGELTIADLTQKPMDPFNPTADTRTENQKQGAEQKEKAEKQIEEIREQLRARQEAGTLPREEASRLYEMMAMLYSGYVGDKEQVEHCLMMARLYKSDQQERDDATKRMNSKNPLQGEVLVPKRDPNEGTSMRGATEDEKELEELDAEDKEMLAEIEGEMYRKGAELQSGKPDYIQVVPFEEKLSEKSNERKEQAEGAAGVIYLIKLALEWYITDRNMKALATRREKKAELEEKIKRENTVRVPPDPEKIRATIKWLAANNHQKMAAKMRLVLDAALAFYDKR